MRIVLPAPLAARARAVAAGEVDAATVEPASTVALVRARGSRSGPGSDALEVYLQQRNRTVAFGGVHAFPGGRVDESDAVVDASNGSAAAGVADPAAWARRFRSSSAAEAAAHVTAAVREVAEETGVRIGADALVGWSRWVTPRFERRRFDAWFFVAALPAGQEPRTATAESDAGTWMTPRDALSAHEQGSVRLLPPTWWTLREIAERRTLARVLADPPAMQRYTVGWRTDDGDVVMALPDDPAYPGDDPWEGT